MEDVRVISREQLKSRIDAGDDFKLVMVLGEWAYRAAHIPGSLNITSPEQATSVFDKEDEIVVYCSDKNCIASQYAYRLLVEDGYAHVLRYEGGLSDWQAAGLPLEGEGV